MAAGVTAIFRQEEQFHAGMPAGGLSQPIDGAVMGVTVDEEDPARRQGLGQQPFQAWLEEVPGMMSQDMD